MKKTITYIFGITLIGNFVNAETLIYAGNIITNSNIINIRK